MPKAESTIERDFFGESDRESCRIETSGGTVYWLSEAGPDRQRWVVREHLQRSNTNTMVMHTFSHDTSLDFGDKFRGRLASDVRVGHPFVLEAPDSSSRILSEPVVAIEAGNVPEMLFGD